jgi:hypothetical protein
MDARWCGDRAKSRSVLQNVIGGAAYEWVTCGASQQSPGRSEQRSLLIAMDRARAAGRAPTPSDVLGGLLLASLLLDEAAEQALVGTGRQRLLQPIRNLIPQS